MTFLFEVIGQFLVELILQALGELLVELGLRSMAETVKRPRSPALAAFGFLLWGALVGSLSLLVVPHSPIEDPSLRWVNLFATPVLVGLMMMVVGKIRDKKGQKLVRLDRFGFAFIFAFSMALVRFIWAG